MLSKLELKVPPVVVVLATVTLMWVAARLTPALTRTFGARYILAGFLGCSGLLISYLGVISFRRAKTTVNPLKPHSASSLVASGIYQRTRNPMYLGFLMVLAGWAVLLSNVVAFIFLPLFILYMNRFQIRPEERALATLFGEEFALYRSKVRRWL
jgi:protein-S-isoprenylcysteine O-methyltransferase Ste14